MYRKFKGLLGTGLLIILFSLLITTPVKAAGVARIGNKTYSSFAKAVEKVKNRQTIVLLKNTSLKKHIYLNKKKSFTINLNKHTLKLKEGKKFLAFGCFTINKGSVTVKNGKMTVAKNTDTLFEVGKKAKLIIKSGTYKGHITNHGKTTIKKGNFICHKAGESLIFNSGNLVIKNGTFTSKYTNSNVLFNANKATISNGTFSSKGYDCIETARSYPYKVIGTTVINGGTFINTGDGNALSAVDCKSLTINKAKVTGCVHVANGKAYVKNSTIYNSKREAVRVSTKGVFDMSSGSISVGKGEFSAMDVYDSGKAYLRGGSITGGYTIRKTEKIGDSILETQDDYPVISADPASVSVGSSFKIINRGQGKNIGY